MTDPQCVLESIKYALKSSDRLPDSTSYATFEIDEDGGQSNVRPPVVEITAPDVIRNDRHNTNFIRYATDDAGNHIGYVYHALFEMDVEIDVWTAEGDGYDPDEIGRAVRNTLYQYDNKQYDDPLPDPNGGTLDDVDRFVVSNGGVRNDLTMTPALRRWRQTGEVWFREVINTAEEYGEEDYITTVIAPEDGKMESGTDVEIIFDATPNEDSTADQY